LAARERAQLHVVHAWSFFGESLLRGRGRVFAHEIARITREEEGRREALLGEFLARFAQFKPQPHFVRGDAGSAVPRAVERLRPDLLVLGTVCRSGVPGLLIGNTAERVLDAVNCSVLTVKPRDFVSPVKVG
jgi:nucleotide-binding universal stress UspA family protein